MRRLSGVFPLLQMVPALLQNVSTLWRSARPFPRHASTPQPPRSQHAPTSIVSNITGKLREWRERYLLIAAISHLSFHRSGTAHDPAIKHCRRLTRDYPERSAMWLALGQRWLDASAEAFDGSDEPLRCFQNVLRLAPDCVEGWYGLGMTLQHQGDAAGAADAYRAVLEREPSHVAARFRLWCLAKKDPGLAASAIGPCREPGGYLREIGLDAAARSSEAEVGELRAVQRHGAVLIRNAVPDQTIAAIRGLIVPFVERYDYSKTVTIPYSASPPELKAALDGLIRGVIFGRLLPLLSEWHARGWRPLPNPTRWVQYFPPRQDETRPLGFGTSLHQDHAVHCQQSDWTTFWTGFSPCGPGIASTLRVLTVPLRNPIDPLDRHPRRINRVPAEWIEEFFGRAMVSPSIDPGDVICFGRYMLHDTYFDPQMHRERISFDARWKTGPSRADLNTFR